jgi:hypothetical protein
MYRFINQEINKYRKLQKKRRGSSAIIIQPYIIEYLDFLRVHGDYFNCNFKDYIFKYHLKLFSSDFII